MSNHPSVVLLAMYDRDSLAVRALHAFLDRAGVAVQSVFFKQLNPNNTMDPETEREIDLLLDHLRRTQPAVVGLSVRSTYFQLAARISQRIRRELDTFIVWGGVHATISPEQCLDHADAVCLGEGEHALLELVQALQAGRPFASIANLWLRRDGDLIRNDVRPLIADLDSLPFPDFHDDNKLLIDADRIGPPPPPAQRKTWWIMTSRGCPYRCSYCCNNILHDVYTGKGPFVRRRSVANVMEELHAARRDFPNLEFISFEDDVFTLNKHWIKDFAQHYRDAIALPFFCYCHPRAVREEIIERLKQAGATNMTMGIQSGSQTLRHEYFERFDDNEQIVRAAHILRRHGIHCSFDIIMDNPLETEEDRRQTLELLLQLPRPFELHTHALTHFPKTRLSRVLLERGFIGEEDLEDQKQLSYKRWTPSLDLQRDRENLFWDNLYYLASKRDVPERLIWWLSRRRLLRRWPHLLTLLLRCTTNYVQTVQAGSRWDWLRVRLVTHLLRHYRTLRNRWAHLRARNPLSRKT